MDMFFVRKKLQQRKDELSLHRYRDVSSIDSFVVKESLEGVPNPQVPTNFEGWDTMHIGSMWKGRDRYMWMHFDLDIPAEWAGKRVVGVFDFGRTGDGNNSGFESLLYLNGKPYQGVDVNHKEVFFDESLYGTTVSMTFRLWSGFEGGGTPRDSMHRIKMAQLCWLDEATDDLYYMSDMILKAFDEIPENNPVHHDLMASLDRAYRLIDWTYTGSESFYESVAKADELLNKEIDGMEKHSDVNVYAVGHTHIDVAWLWRLKNTREKCSRSFSTVMRLMEMFPEYIFLQTQPQLYEYIKEDFPELYNEIKSRVKEGRWEADGGMWVEADCNLTSGESLTRQILIGSKFIKDEFGKDVHYLWLPDVFGYSWALPQILKKSGIDMFMTTKISWNQYNRMPHDTFKWRGIDGSEVLTHFITTPEPWGARDSWFYTYNGQLIPRSVQGVWDAYSEKHLNKDMLVSYGYGDGGGGVNRDQLEQRRRLDKIPGLPHVKTSTAGAYFEKLKNNIKNADGFVNTWDGELYLEYHRGTYTSHAHNKRMNRKMELLYREAEWLTVMDALAQGGNLDDAQQEKLTTGWKHILTDQFHDIIPGSSIFEVYEDSKKDYEWIEQVANEVERDYFSRNKSESSETVYTIINNNGFDASENILIENCDAEAAYLLDGTKLTTQKTENGLLVAVKDVPAMGSMQICLNTDDISVENSENDENKTFESNTNRVENADKNAFEVKGREIISKHYELTMNEYGQLTRLYDKEAEREVIPEGQCANILQVFEDKPMGNDAWDIDIFYQEKMEEVKDITTFEIVENGPVRLVVRLGWTYNKSNIWQDMILYADSRRIDFVTKVDCHEHHKLLKAAFPVDIRTTYGTFDVQYGNVRRPNHWNTSWDQAKFETVAHRFADLSEYGYGVSLLNDCKYGHDVKDNMLRITLIKTAGYPDYNQDQGEHFFTYSLFPHQGDFVEGGTVQEASLLNQPLHVVKDAINMPKGSFISFETTNVSRETVELDAIKKTEDGKYIAVRFHDYTGGTRKVKVNTGFEWKKYCVSDLRERPLNEWKDKEEIKLTVKPYEIVTLLFEI